MCTMYKVSVIIPSFNRANTVGITLDSFIYQNYPKEMYEIIVVDNNSTDNTKSVIKSYCDNNRNIDIKYLFESRQGVHYARNSAAKHAKYEILYYNKARAQHRD